MVQRPHPVMHHRQQLVAPRKGMQPALMPKAAPLCEAARSSSSRRQASTWVLTRMMSMTVMTMTMPPSSFHQALVPLQQAWARAVPVAADQQGRGAAEAVEGAAVQAVAALGPAVVAVAVRVGAMVGEARAAGSVQAVVLAVGYLVLAGGAAAGEAMRTAWCSLCLTATCHSIHGIAVQLVLANTGVDPLCQHSFNLTLM